MRKQYLTFLLTVLMSMVCTTVSAHDFEVDGIYYNILTPITVSVTYRGSSYDAYEEYSGSVAIPAEVTNGNNTYQVVAVGDEAFMSCKSLTAVTFPRCLKSIGTNAFNLCQGLTSVTLPTTLESIGNAAFWNCSKLKTVTALMRTPPTSLYMAFYVTSSAKLYVRIGTRDAYVADDYWSQFGEIIEMNIPSRAIIFEELLTEDLCVMAWDTDNDGYLSAPEAAAVTDLGTVFYEQPITSFKELSFFIGLTSITSRAFYNCGNLSSVNIPNKVTSIGDYAFLGCTMLKSITIPNGVTSIEQSAFYDCRSLTSVTLPNSVTSIGNEAFADCTSLTSISIPNSVTSIGEFAFYKCRKLESVNIPLGVPIISKYAFYDCGSLTSLTIPNSVTIIDDGAFMYCNNLTSISIPNCVTSIGDWAFFDCMGLASVIIGSSVETIGKGAFPDVDKYKLSDIYCLGKTAPSAVDAFSGTLSKIKLHIPMDGAYYNQEPWRSMTQDYRQICATPTYSLVGSTLKFECETPGVTYHYNYTVEGENADHLDTGGKCTVTFYAKKEGYTDSLPVTAVVDMPATLKGDVNQDGKVTITDAVNVVDIILGVE